jgi:Escherichia/Staphylococcus phage prohead protease
MPLPTPSQSETQDNFMRRCMGSETMKADFKSQDQRAAVCMAQWRKGHRDDDDGLHHSILDIADSDVRLQRGPTTVRQMLVGHPIVFHSLSHNLGAGIRERVLPVALERTFKEQKDVVALLDHDPSKVMGRLHSREKTLRMEMDSQGLYVEIDPPDTSYAKDIMEVIGRNDVGGMSFGFRILDARWEESGEGSIRELLDIDLREVSIVTFPAYPKTDVALANRMAAEWRHRPQYASYRPSLAMNRARQRQAEW